MPIATISGPINPAMSLECVTVRPFAGMTRIRF